jgi:phosphotriesterase-related protein
MSLLCLGGHLRCGCVLAVRLGAAVPELAADLFGQESSYYSLGPIDMPNDATRVDYIVDLIARGHAAQVLISQDICHKTNLTHYGGEGFTHILDNVRPLMRRKGIDDAQIAAITVDNPARAISFLG